MPRYLVSGAVTVSAYTLVEAGSPEEACQIARKRTIALSPDGRPEQRGLNPWEEAIIEDADGEMVETSATLTDKTPDDDTDEDDDG